MKIWISKRRPDMLCFVHIERAGGTTLHYIIRNNFLSFLTLTPSLWSNDPTTIFTAKELRALLRWLPYTKGFGGHNTRAYVQYESVTDRPIRYFTFLRNPIARYLSHFSYQVDRMNRPWSLDSFLSEPRFANYMTTRIAGGPDVTRAKELLREQFVFVGLTERFDESLVLLRHALDLHHFDIRYEHKNAGRGRLHSPSNDLLNDPDTLTRVRSQNLLDLELYDFARNELYPEYVNRYGSELSGDVDRFREENDGFRFHRRRRYAWGIYRKFLYQPLETAIRHRHRQPR